VGWADSLEKRASDLREDILRLTEDFTLWPRVHIIAHSMGGLDARAMLYQHRMKERVASLTTIGTPHLGTSYADWGLKRFDGLIDLARPLGVDLSGFRNLTREACRQFNEELENFESTNRVLYQTIAGAQPRDRVYMPLRLSHWIVEREEGENDGLVSVISAMWKEEYFLERIDADHLNQLGWWNWSEGRSGKDRETFEQDMRDLYVRIALGLRD
jgi:triacylglycerol lipase